MSLHRVHSLYIVCAVIQYRVLVVSSPKLILCQDNSVTCVCLTMANNMQVERPKRARNPPNVFTPTKTAVNTNFALNKKKAIEKKLQATMRKEDVDVELKSGTLVLTMSAAAYELFKTAVFDYYDNHPRKKYTVYNKTSATRNNETAIVDQSLSIRRKNVNSQIYRVNLFHTTSRVDANGKMLSEFITDDLPAILKEVFRSCDLQILNNKIKEKCQEYLISESVQSPTKSPSSNKLRESKEKAPDTRKQLSAITNGEDQSQLVNRQIVPVPQQNSVALPTVSANCIAQSILAEETDACCMSCNGNLDSTQSDTCEICNNVCHRTCMHSQKDSSNNSIMMCVSCINLAAQRTIINNTVSQSNSQDCVVTHPDSGNTSTKKVLDARAESDSNQKQKESVKKNGTTAKDTSDTTGTKLKDLRQKEAKLRKWEEELKLKETQLKATEADRTRRETYISQIESRNLELEQTIRILKRRVTDLERGGGIDTNICAEGNKMTGADQLGRTGNAHDRNHIGSLVEKMHEKVSSFILHKMDKQINDLCHTHSETEYVRPSGEIHNNQYVRPTQQSAYTGNLPTPHNASQTMSWPSATHTQYTQAHVPNHYQGRPLYYQGVHINRAAAQPNNQHFLAWRPQTRPHR